MTRYVSSAFVTKSSRGYQFAEALIFRGSENTLYEFFRIAVSLQSCSLSDQSERFMEFESILLSSLNLFYMYTLNASYNLQPIVMNEESFLLGFSILC